MVDPPCGPLPSAQVVVGWNTKINTKTTVKLSTISLILFTVVSFEFSLHNTAGGSLLKKSVCVRTRFGYYRLNAKALHTNGASFDPYMAGLF